MKTLPLPGSHQVSDRTIGYSIRVGDAAIDNAVVLSRVELSSKA